MKKLAGVFSLFLAIAVVFGCYDDTGKTANISLSGDESSFSGAIMVKLRDDKELASKQLSPLVMSAKSLEPLMKGHRVRSIRRLVPDNGLEGFRMRARSAGNLSNDMIEKRSASKKRWHVVRFENLAIEDARDLCDELRKDPRIEYAEPDHKVSLDETFPNDPNMMFGLQWSLFNLDMYDAWDYTTGAGDVVVAVIDTGVDYTHEDLAGNCIAGYDYLNNDADPMDDTGHGTHVAGIIGAVGNNGQGNAGMAWQVRIMPLRFISEDPGNPDYALSGDISLGIDCINYAVSNGAHIINASYGCYYYSEAEREAIMDARDAGVLFVAAAGNGLVNSEGIRVGLDTDATPSYPASYNLDNIISVAASTYADQLRTSSNYGIMTVDLAAPGEEIYSTMPKTLTYPMSQAGLNMEWDYMSGTSMAAPHVTGVAALIKSLRPEFNYANIKTCVLHGIEELPHLSDKVLTGGKLNGYNSVSYAATYTQPAPSSIIFTLPPDGKYTTPWQWLGLATKPLVLTFTVASTYPIASVTNATLVSGNTYSLSIETGYSTSGNNDQSFVISFVDSEGYIKEFKTHYTTRISLGYLIVHYVYRTTITYNFVQ
ncbi:MAG: S8 family serine peptidase [Spirochaetes bacterium]|nr:S8 family serine peptidase [Spirochaetota bacterium]